MRIFGGWISDRWGGINTLTTLDTQAQGFAIGVDFFKDQAETLSQGDSIGFLGFDFVATDAAGNVTTKTVTITNIDKDGWDSFVSDPVEAAELARTEQQLWAGFARDGVVAPGDEAASGLVGDVAEFAGDDGPAVL